MIVLVTGDRDWTDRRRITQVLDGLHAASPITLLVEGCARGADVMAGGHEPRRLTDPGWAWANRISGCHHPAYWERYGRAAGPIRNDAMLRHHLADTEAPVDLVVAFHDHIMASHGTRDMIRRAQEAGIPVRLFTRRAEIAVPTFAVGATVGSTSAS